MLTDIQQQKRLKVLLIGDSCRDKFHYGHCNRISPEAPVPVLSHKYTDTMGGMALNVYNNLLAYNSVVDVDIVTNEEQITKERFVDLDSGQHIMRLDTGESSKLNQVNLNCSEINSISSYDLVIISDYEKGFITEQAAKVICKFCLLCDIPVFVDSKKRDISCYEGAIVKLNEREEKELECNFPSQHLVVTLGPAGAKWEKKTYPVTRVDVFDVSGAGDTFLSVLAINYVKNNRQLEEAIIKANKAASYVVQKSGTYSLKEKDIEKLCI